MINASSHTGGEAFYVAGGLRILFLHFHFLHFAEQIAGKDQIVELLIGGVDDLVFVSLPLLVSFVDEDDVLADTHDRVHVMGVDDRRHLIVFGNL